jgi:hypothetical protein
MIRHGLKMLRYLIIRLGGEPGDADGGLTLSFKYTFKSGSRIDSSSWMTRSKMDGSPTICPASNFFPFIPTSDDWELMIMMG